MNLKFVVYSICLSFLPSHSSPLLQLVCQIFFGNLIDLPAVRGSYKPDQTCNCNEPLMLAFSAKNIRLKKEYYISLYIHTRYMRKFTKNQQSNRSITHISLHTFLPALSIGRKINSFRIATKWCQQSFSFYFSLCFYSLHRNEVCGGKVKSLLWNWLADRLEE